MKTKTIMNLLSFYTNVEKLKATLRNASTSDAKRRESVADHSWMMSLIALTLFSSLKVRFNKEKVLKLIIIHDIAESITGDIPTYEKSDRKKHKRELEQKAINELTANLDNPLKKELLSLWNEFDENLTVEAKIAQAIDKVEIIIQHNNADITTWNDHHFGLNPYYMHDYFNFDSFLRELKDVIDIEVLKKIERANLLHKLKSNHIKIYKQSNNLK